MGLEKVLVSDNIFEQNATEDLVYSEESALRSSTNLKWSGPSGGIFSGQYEGPLRLRFILLKYEEKVNSELNLYEIITAEASKTESWTLVRENSQKKNTKRIAIGEIHISYSNNNYDISIFSFLNHVGESCNVFLKSLIASNLMKMRVPDTCYQATYRLKDIPLENKNVDRAGFEPATASILKK